MSSYHRLLHLSTVGSSGQVILKPDQFYYLEENYVGKKQRKKLVKEIIEEILNSGEN